MHLEREIEKLKRKLLALSSLVEESVYRAIKAFLSRDQVSASSTLTVDDEIDAMEVEVEEECLKVLALYQPVAVDLRYIVAILKINNDLERIGDLSVNIAHRVRTLSAVPLAQEPLAVLESMADKATAMLRDSLQGMVKGDVELSKNVCRADTDVDQLNRRMHQIIIALLKEPGAEVNDLISVLTTARNLERIADHATNIAEDVIYLNKGEIVRHRRAI